MLGRTRLNTLLLWAAALSFVVHVSSFATKIAGARRRALSSIPVNEKGGQLHGSTVVPPSMTTARHVDSTSALSVGRWTDDELQGSDRFKACVPYILPLIDGDPFGVYIYDRIPPLNLLHEIFLEPLVYINHKVPFFTLGLFLAFTLGTRFNTSIDRNVRFSAQQAALIDIALLFPELIASGFQEDPVPRYIAEPCANLVFYSYMSAVLYSIYSNIRGKRPDEIPFISSGANLMVGPF